MVKNPRQTAHGERFFISWQLWLRALLTRNLPLYRQKKTSPLVRTDPLDEKSMRERSAAQATTRGR
jgi:hypothetical protein